MARALVTLGTMLRPEIDNPRAWLFRVATNLYIDRTRRAREELGQLPEAPAPPAISAPNAKPRVRYRQALTAGARRRGAQRRF